MPLIHLHSQLSDTQVNNYVGSLFISFTTEADLYIGPFLASWRWNTPLVPCDFKKVQLFLVTNVNWWCPSRAVVRGWMALSWKRFLLLYTDQGSGNQQSITPLFLRICMSWPTWGFAGRSCWSCQEGKLSRSGGKLRSCFLQADVVWFPRDWLWCSSFVTEPHPNFIQVR